MHGVCSADADICQSGFCLATFVYRVLGKEEPVKRSSRAEAFSGAKTECNKRVLHKLAEYDPRNEMMASTYVLKLHGSLSESVSTNNLRNGTC